MTKCLTCMYLSNIFQSKKIKKVTQIFKKKEQCDSAVGSVVLLDPFGFVRYVGSVEFVAWVCWVCCAVGSVWFCRICWVS